MALILSTYRPGDWLRFVEVPYFTAKWKHLGLDDDDLRALQLALTTSPGAGAVVAGTGGLRKYRFRSTRDNRGKSGSYRIGYVRFDEQGVICLIAVYAKRDQAEIAPADRKKIKALIDQLRTWVVAQTKGSP